jgi:hypothetical protein
MATKPAFQLRGVMLDLGRITERLSYYQGLLPRLAEWGYNLLHLHLIDDQRCALRFPSRPELATPGAFSPEEMRRFVELAERQGIAVMPEIECLGHTALITGHRKYRHLGERSAHQWGFNAICPSHPETREILAEVLRDTAEIFPHEVIHVGLDEVEFGKCPRCRRRFGAESEPWQRFAAHSAWVHQEVRRLGRRPAMWADHVVGEPRIMRSFRRDVLMFNWQYIAEYESPNAARLLDAGFETVACPATVCYGTRIAPNRMNLGNLRNVAARSLPQRRRGRGLTGLVNTVWCPWRYLPGAIDYGMALAGHLMTAGGEDPRFAERFARRFYGLSGPGGRRVGRALNEFHEGNVEQRLHDRAMTGACRSEPFTAEDRRQLALVVEGIKPVLTALQAERAKVRRNRERYDDLVISAEAVLTVARFGAAGRRKSAVPGARALYRRAEKAWGRDRHPADSLRFGDGRHGAVQSLLWALRKLS